MLWNWRAQIVLNKFKQNLLLIFSVLSPDLDITDSSRHSHLCPLKISFPIIYLYRIIFRKTIRSNQRSQSFWNRGSREPLSLVYLFLFLTFIKSKSLVCFNGFFYLWQLRQYEKERFCSSPPYLNNKALDLIPSLLQPTFKNYVFRENTVKIRVIYFLNPFNYDSKSNRFSYCPFQILPKHWGFA